ncbi:ETC complex I subunit conserved region-domain-containing protein [Flammula alnicola]|nr:ETC complex I subunit conserved region-domain-containing protein [Flammula alnicola]
MSLLRSCTQSASIARRTVLAAAPRLARSVSTEGSAPPAEKKEAQKSGSIAIQPTRDVLVADVISGAPGELRHRSVRIYQPTRNTMQSGSGKTERWRIDFDTLPGGGRWENPLMGYASSADYMQGTRISFRSKEDAVHFAEKQGWDYFVQAPASKRIPPKNYAENYVYKPHTLRIMRTK